MSVLGNYGSFSPATILNGRRKKHKDSQKSPPTALQETPGDTKRNTNTQCTQTYTCKQVSTCWLGTRTHAKQSGGGGGGGRKVTQGASSFSQAGYLQRLVLHQPGETSPGLRQCLGGAWGLGRWTWTCPPRSRQRTKTHLQRQAGTPISVWPEFRAKLWVAHQFASDNRSWERKKRCRKGDAGSLFELITPTKGTSI